MDVVIAQKICLLLFDAVRMHSSSIKGPKHSQKKLSNHSLSHLDLVKFQHSILNTWLRWASTKLLAYHQHKIIESKAQKSTLLVSGHRGSSHGVIQQALLRPFRRSTFSNCFCTSSPQCWIRIGNYK